MKIQIKTKNTIPVEIGELTFEVSMSDDSIQKMMDNFELVGDKINTVDTKNIGAVKGVYIEALDLLLGEGSGQTIYAKYPSVLMLNEITTQLSVNLKEEIQELTRVSTQTEVMQEYIKNKNK